MRWTLLSAPILALVLLLAPAPLVSADEHNVPSDVRDAYSQQALDDLRRGPLDIGSPDYSDATAFGGPHRIALWSAEYISGAATERPLELLEEWVAPILDSHGDAIGTYRVWRYGHGATPTLAAFDGDAVLGAALADLDPDSLVVDDGPTASWFAVTGDLVSPLTQWAAQQLPNPVPLQDAQATVHAAYQKMTPSIGVDETTDESVTPPDSAGEESSDTDAVLPAVEGVVLVAITVTAILVTLWSTRRQPRRQAPLP